MSSALRRLLDGDWRAGENTLVIGLAVESGLEALVAVNGQVVVPGGVEHAATNRKRSAR